MLFLPKEILLKNGERAVLRSADPEDAQMLLQYLKTTSAETPFLLRAPEEIFLTEASERAFITGKKEAERELLLLAEIDGVHAGNASLSSVGPYRRTAHRCSVAIALYKRYWGLGLGCAMLCAVLETAEQLGYEQAELQVSAANARAIALYESLGFYICGTLPQAMMFPDRSYADEYTMVKRLSA